MITDTVVPAALLPQCVALAAGSDCDQACAGTQASFDGSELAGTLYGMDDSRGVSGILGQCAGHIPVAAALSRRGCVVLTFAGRIGVTIGYGRVVEPAGRQYVIVQDGPSRYQLAFDPGRVVFTMGAA